MRNWKRCLQLRLSTLLILVFVIGVILGPFSYKFVKHQRALKWLRENDGHVLQWEQGWIYDSPTLVFVYGDISTLDPIQEFTELEHLNVQSRRGNYYSSTIRTLEPLEKLTKLKSVDIATWEKLDLKELNRLRNVKTVWLSSPHVFDLSPIKKNRELETINLSVFIQLGVPSESEITKQWESKAEELAELQRLFPDTDIHYGAGGYVE